MKYELNYIKSVHKYCSNHKSELDKSILCGCFYCCQTFQTNEIMDWIEDKDDSTALCPKCGIDSVLSDEHPIKDYDFLKQMNSYWF